MAPSGLSALGLALLREDGGPTARQPRSAPVARTVLRHARGLRGAGQAWGAEQAVRDRFLLPEDAARIVREADASDVLRQTQPVAPGRAQTLVIRPLEGTRIPAMHRRAGHVAVDAVRLQHARRDGA